MAAPTASANEAIYLALQADIATIIGHPAFKKIETLAPAEIDALGLAASSSHDRAQRFACFGWCLACCWHIAFRVSLAAARH